MSPDHCRSLRSGPGCVSEPVGLSPPSTYTLRRHPSLSLTVPFIPLNQYQPEAEVAEPSVPPGEECLLCVAVVS